MTAISIFDGLPNEAGTQWDFAPEFADVGEAEAYVRAHLTRSTVLTEYAGHAVVTILDEDGDATVVEVTAVDRPDGPRPRRDDARRAPRLS